MRRNQLPAAAIVVAALLFIGACGAKDDAPKATTSSPSATAPAKIIDYGDEGVNLRTPEDVDKLEGAPEDFKQFASGAASQVMTDKSATDKCGPYISVSRVDPAGFASGSVFDCGGAELIWAKVDGIWRQIFGGQFVPPCDLVKKYSVPEAIVGGECDDGGN